MQIRVHGMGGPRPETVLGLEAGTATDRIWRSDPFARSSLRMGSSPDVAVYHWAALTSGSRWFALWPLLLPFTIVNVAGWMHAPGRRAPIARWIARLLALTTSAVVAAWLLLLGQVLAVPAAREGGVEEQVIVAVAVVVLGAIIAVSQVTAHGFEAKTMPAPATATPVEARGWPHLGDRRFFDRASSHTAGVLVHGAAVAATVLVVAAIALTSDHETTRSVAADAVASLSAAQLVLAVAFGAATVRRAGWWSLGAFATATVGVVLVGGLLIAGLHAVVGTCPAGGPIVGDEDAARACAATADAPFALFDAYGLAVLVALGVAVAIAVHALLRPAPGEPAARAAGLLPSVSSRLRARLAVLPSRLIGAVVAAALTFVIFAAVVFPSRAPEAMSPWCDRVAIAPSDSWPCHGTEPTADWQLTATPLVTVAQFAFFGMLSFVVLNLVKTRASPDALRRVGQLWDVLTFWPRSFHPFAVRPYAERAVPELATLLLHRPVPGGAVDLRVHSQGSVLALAALAPYSSDDTDAEHVEAVRVLSFGSPIGTLHSRAFPAYVDRELITLVTSTWRWQNAFRFTDHVGRALFVDDESLWTTGGPDRGLADPSGPGRRIDGHSGYWTDERLEDIT